MKAAHGRDLTAAIALGRPVVRAVRLDGAEERLLGADDSSALGDAVRRALRADTSQTVDSEGVSWFLRPFNPPLRMIVIGAVHVAQPLAVMAGLAGFALTIVDPREAFAREERFSGARIISEWPDDVLPGLSLDARTAVVALTHDPKIDDPGLAAALSSKAFYVGALGSKKTHAARRERLGALGFDEAALARIHAPVGLSIGARSPAEIAVSILAQVIEVLRKVPA